MYLIITKTEEEIAKTLMNKYGFCNKCAQENAPFVQECMRTNQFKRLVFTFLFAGVVIQIDDFVVGNCPIVMN